MYFASSLPQRAFVLEHVYVTLKGDVKRYLCLSKICAVRVFLKQITLAIKDKYQFPLSTQRLKIMKQAVDGQQKNAWCTANPISRRRHWSKSDGGKIEQHEKLDGPD